MQPAIFGRYTLVCHVYDNLPFVSFLCMYASTCYKCIGYDIDALMCRRVAENVESDYTMLLDSCKMEKWSQIFQNQILAASK